MDEIVLWDNVTTQTMFLLRERTKIPHRTEDFFFFFLESNVTKGNLYNGFDFLSHLRDSLPACFKVLNDCKNCASQNTSHTRASIRWEYCKQIFTNLPKSSPLFVFNHPILPNPTDLLQTNVGGSYFFIFKKYIQTNSIPSLWTAFNKKFYGHCDVNDCGHCGSFVPSVGGSPKLAEDHCERVETLHFQPTQMLDNNNHRPRQGALCVLVVCNLHVFILIVRSAVLFSKRIHVNCYLEPPLTSLPKVLRCT